MGNDKCRFLVLQEAVSVEYVARAKNDKSTQLFKIVTAIAHTHAPRHARMHAPTHISLPISDSTPVRKYDVAL